ncbi:MAG: response regulator [Candidatus Dadabacteria bacterium]
MEKTIKILLIEDDIDDVELLQYALDRHSVKYQMEILSNGKEALEYIENCADCPEIIILDFNLPKVHGKEVLKQIKDNADFKNIPLVILTTSSAQDDKDYAGALGANAFLVKPTSTDGIKNTVETIVNLVNTR